MTDDDDYSDEKTDKKIMEQRKQGQKDAALIGGDRRIE